MFVQITVKGSTSDLH